jgi:hypothetical protein
MKKYVFVLFVFVSLIANAQFGNRNNGFRQNQPQRDYTQPKTTDPDFKIRLYLGIIVYNIKKSAKKSSLKLSSKEGKEFSKVLTDFNKRIKGITQINSFLLNSSKKTVDNFQKTARKTGDYSKQPKIQKQMNESLKPLAETLKEEDVKLDKSMKSLLSEKKYKKWVKYNKKMNKTFPIE